jgi:hypothetical protein
MKLDLNRFEKFWNIFVEDAVASCAQDGDPMVINNGVSPGLEAALLSDATTDSAFPDCLGSEEWA